MSHPKLFSGLVCIINALFIAFTILPKSTVLGQAALNARVIEVDPSHSGIDFVHTDGSSGNRYMVETIIGSLAIFDYDNDGWLDIYFLNGAPLLGTVTETPPRNQLYKNNGDWTFTDVTLASGLGDLQYGMGVVVGDYDGDVDLVVLNVNARPTVGRTESPKGNHGYSVRLIGTSTNRDAIGAKIITVSANGKIQTHVLTSGKGYESSYGIRTYFGTGSIPLSQYMVTWSNGKIESFDCNSAFMTLIEGRGRSQQ